MQPLAVSARTHHVQPTRDRSGTLLRLVLMRRFYNSIRHARAWRKCGHADTGNSIAHAESSIFPERRALSMPCGLAME